MGDEYNGEISDDESETTYIIDIGNIILNAKDQNRILDDGSVGTMKSTAEALMKTPRGWEDDSDFPGNETDTTMKEDDIGTPSSTITSTNELSVEQMTPQQLEELVSKASEQLKLVQLASDLSKTASNKGGGDG
jgi:hypothetical protein